MSNLAARLAKVDPDLQSAVAYGLVESASLDEVIDALKMVPSSIEHHFIDELVLRGPPVLDATVHALLEDPLAPFARRFGEVLVQLYQYHPPVRARAATALIAAASGALDAGGGTKETASLFILLADCATIAGPLPEAVPVARRLLAVARGEDHPSVLATGFAQRILNPPRRPTDPPAKPRSRRRR